jgi:RNA polymerase sigma-70 factor (ECF subfamily)
VVMLKFYEGWDNEEIAEALQKPVGSVKSLQHRALNALHRILAEEEEKNYEAIVTTD